MKYSNKSDDDDDDNFTAEQDAEIDAFMNAPRHYRLSYCNGVSVFENYIKPGEDEEKEYSSTEGNVTYSYKFVRAKSKNIWYKNFNKNELIMNLEIFGKLFLIEETLTAENWKLEDEEKTIGDFVCKKASRLYKGDTLTAYYTEDIPIPDGPADFFGLPGLVVDLTKNGEPFYYLTTLKIINENTDFAAPEKGKKVTMEEFEKIKDKKISETEEIEISY